MKFVVSGYTIVARIELFQNYFYFLFFSLFQKLRKSEVSGHLQERTIFYETLYLKHSNTPVFLEFANS